MKNKTWKKLTTLLTVFALLLLIPAGVMLADSDEEQEEPEKQEVLLTSEMEGEEDPDELEGGGKSLIVAERIAAALALGIPPGHLNLLDRLAFMAGQTREDVLALWQDAPIQSIMKEIKRLRFEAKGKELPAGRGHAYGKIKGG
jgi:hypothetical protein